MSESVFFSIITLGFVVAFAHAALPTHWLPFVLAGRGQGWTKSKTLSVTALAGVGHTLFTTFLGVLVVFMGMKTQSVLGSAFPVIVGGILIAFGLFYLIHHKRGHHHWHLPWGKKHDHGHAHAHDHGGETYTPGRSDKAVILGLLAVLTFSPCEGFLPVYLSGIHYGWSGFLVLSVTLAVATTAGMLFFTWLTLAGLERIRISVLEKYESAILGVLLILMGVLVMLVEG